MSDIAWPHVEHLIEFITLKPLRLPAVVVSMMMWKFQISSYKNFASRYISNYGNVRNCRSFVVADGQLIGILRYFLVTRLTSSSRS
jgi:hypothetical protein